jgi:hypothetical protein
MTQQRRAEGGREGERGVKQTKDKSWYEKKSKGVRPARKKVESSDDPRPGGFGRCTGVNIALSRPLVYFGERSFS